MKITFTGRQVELAPAQLKKVQARFAKVGKLLDSKKECEAHVILSLQRHLQKAEITVNYHGNSLVVAGANADLFTAMSEAVEKLEKQALKVREKWRDSKRKQEEVPIVVETAPEPEPEVEKERRVYKVNQHQRRKPMTLDEALIEMEKDRDYLVYRDAETDRTAVLMRRRDGNFDLVES